MIVACSHYFLGGRNCSFMKRKQKKGDTQCVYHIFRSKNGTQHERATSKPFTGCLTTTGADHTSHELTWWMEPGKEQQAEERWKSAEETSGDGSWNIKIYGGPGSRRRTTGYGNRRKLRVGCRVCCVSSLFLQENCGKVNRKKKQKLRGETKCLGDIKEVQVYSADQVRGRERNKKTGTRDLATAVVRIRYFQKTTSEIRDF